MMKRIAAVTCAGVLLLAVSGSCHWTDQNAQIRDIQRLESLARSGTPDSLRQLMDVCASDKQSAPLRRLACRLASRKASSASFEEHQPPSVSQIGGHRQDPTGVSWEIAKARVDAREKGEDKAATVRRLVHFWDDLNRECKAATGEQKVRCGMQLHAAASEIAFYVVDLGLPTGELPEEVRRQPDAIYADLRAEWAQMKDSEARMDWVIQQMGNRDPLKAEAAVRLAVDEGEPMVPRLIALLRSKLPKKNPPPYTPEVTLWSRVVGALAGIGGREAIAAIRPLATSDIPYVVENANSVLSVLEAGNKLPVQYARLLADDW